MKRIVCLFAVMALFTAPAWADDKQNASADKGKDSAQAQGVQSWTTAMELADYGRATNSPLALVVAAQMLKAAPAQTVDRDKASEGDETKAGDKQAATPVSAATLLAEAKEMAGDDLQLVAVIDAEAKREGTRGDVTGPNDHYDEVLPRHTDVYTIVFRGGEIAKVAVIGDGDNDLDLFIYDENGNLIESDTDATDRCYVEWTPRWTGPFKVKIKNLGYEVYSAYRLLTN